MGLYSGRWGWEEARVSVEEPKVAPLGENGWHGRPLLIPGMGWQHLVTH